MLASGSNGVLVPRLASHVAAACSTAVVGLLALRQLATAAAPSDGPREDDVGASAIPPLTAEQKQQLPALLAALQRPGDLAQRLGGLTSMAVSYRDLSVTLGALQMRQHDLEPLVDQPADLASQLRLQDAVDDTSSSATVTIGVAGKGASAAKPPPLPQRRGTFLPLKDVTVLPEDVAVDGRSEAPPEPQYHLPYMDKISCWAAMQPSHLEMSQSLMTGIKLFPPVEATYPTYVDFDAATRMLSHRISRKRMRLQRRLLRKQDKYQIKTWDHYAGEA
ncbi:hypothetical protein Vretimale_14980 [Volvox reticuliferus]|uniref:Uncharacterized protein n=1 Tax=Volvox reticuliferus TaxID=1737510 RepID=A0A8J4GN83_9CHLO|nr:hypothetical protein Vretifemale_19521 [Volvox reticuliferus]GIM11494.1 hypothetical protein Vretimale_14980 [Volvox reticuliferus]